MLQRRGVGRRSSKERHYWVNFSFFFGLFLKIMVGIGLVFELTLIVLTSQNRRNKRDHLSFISSSTLM